MSDVESQTIAVTGMSCEHCVAAVNGALSELPGVSGVDVDLGRGLVVVRGGYVDAQLVRDAVRAAGYGVLEQA